MRSEFEPKFLLCARDLESPLLVSLAAAIRADNRDQAYKIVTEIMDRFHTFKPKDGNRADVALRCAVDMMRWRKSNRQVKGRII